MKEIKELIRGLIISGDRVKLLSIHIVLDLIEDKREIDAIINLIGPNSDLFTEMSKFIFDKESNKPDNSKIEAINKVLNASLLLV